MFVGKVPSSNTAVSSQYAEGYFIQHPDSKGRIYNVNGHIEIVLTTSGPLQICVSDAVMQTNEKLLVDLVHLYQSRLEWLNTDRLLNTPSDSILPIAKSCP